MVPQLQHRPRTVVALKSDGNSASLRLVSEMSSASCCRSVQTLRDSEILTRGWFPPSFSVG